jgi:hypothetical protein
MRQDRFLGEELKLNPESKVNVVVEQNPSVTKTEASLKSQIKKIALSFAFFPLIAMNVFAQENKNNDWERDGLTGKVKSIKEIWYEAVDKLGNTTKGAEYIPSFGLTSSIITKYDTFGNMIIQDWYGVSMIKYKCDNYGNRIEKSTYSLEDSTLSIKSIYKNNEKGKVIEENEYTADGTLSQKIIYLYDEWGNNIEINHYDKEGTFSYKQNFEYDRQNRIIKGVLIDNYTSMYAYAYNRFDSKGNWIERIGFGGESNMPEAVYERIIEYYE